MDLSQIQADFIRLACDVCSQHVKYRLCGGGGGGGGGVCACVCVMFYVCNVVQEHSLGNCW